MAKPDIIATDDGELLAIEVKSTRKKYAMFNKDQVDRLLEFCRRFRVKCPRCGVEIRPKPILAVRFLNRGWKFIEVPEGWDSSIIVRDAEVSPRLLQSSPSHVGDGAGSSSLRMRAPK